MKPSCPISRNEGFRVPATAGSWAALLSSACCRLPLLLLAFGVSATGVSPDFAATSPLFLTLAGLFLAAGFYLVDFRKPACRPRNPFYKPNTLGPAPRLEAEMRALS